MVGIEPGGGRPWLQCDRASLSTEWLAKKHGAHRRRQYRKFLLAMDAGSGDIRAAGFSPGNEVTVPCFQTCLH